MSRNQVLLVVDDDDLAVQLGHVLFEFEYDVHIARKAEAAIAKLVELPNLMAVVVERNLPDRGCEILLHACASEEDLMTTPVVLLGDGAEMPQGAWAVVLPEDPEALVLLLNQLRAD